MRMLLCGLTFGALALMSSQQSFPAPATVPAPWILRVNEAQGRWDDEALHFCRPAWSSPSFQPAVRIYSQLNVDRDGNAVYRESCNGRAEEGLEGGLLAPGTPDKTYSLKLSAAQIASLASFMNTQNVREITSFLNAAPIDDSYQITITRGEKQQQIYVTAFMPSHMELLAKPALTQLICRAKEIEGLASQSKWISDWCKPYSAYSSDQ
jgi:hypothetical protein